MPFGNLSDGPVEFTGWLNNASSLCHVMTCMWSSAWFHLL